MAVDMRVWDGPRQWEIPWLMSYDLLGVSGRAGWALVDPGTGDLQVLELANRRCVRTFPKDFERGTRRDTTAFSGDCGYAVVAESEGFPAIRPRFPACPCRSADTSPRGRTRHPARSVSSPTRRARSSRSWTVSKR
ncbi:hypothetical protein V2I01_38610 [Micromonospora sp. BRA006-A]|nr:hypothetical protein [Micromonospora sp. BRA006-A]